MCGIVRVLHTGVQGRTRGDARVLNGAQDAWAYCELILLLLVLFCCGAASAYRPGCFNGAWEGGSDMGESGSTIATMVYDGAGRRVQRPP